MEEKKFKEWQVGHAMLKATGIFSRVVKAILLTALLALTLLLACAFESRSMPALHIRHTAFPMDSLQFD